MGHLIVQQISINELPNCRRGIRILITEQYKPKAQPTHPQLNHRWGTGTEHKVPVPVLTTKIRV
jgi:hypothetical protein